MNGFATPKLATMVSLAALSLFGGLLLGQGELVVLAAPFVLAVALGLAATSAPAIEVHFEAGAERCIEGEEIEAVVVLNSARDAAEAEIGLALPRGFEVVDGPQRRVVGLVAGEPRRIVWRLRAARWGAHSLGIVALRVHGPGRLVLFERVVDLRRAVKVYPVYERISRALPAIDTQLLSGDYVARSEGDGIQFASVRPFVVGDSVRRVNWRVTSRRSELHVNVAHPERNSDVLLFLDTFTDVDLPGGSCVDTAVRGAAALARHHLEHNDRVGLVGFGGILRWLTASMGRTHAYRIADFLLDVNATFSYAWKNIDVLPYGTLPPGALVIAFSPIVDERALKAFADMRARGTSLLVIDTLEEDSIAPGEGLENRIAHRAWKLQRERLRAQLTASGVPVIEWPGPGGLAAVLAAAPRLRRRTRAPRR